MNKKNKFEAIFIGGLIILFIYLMVNALVYSMKQIGLNTGNVGAICFWGLVAMFITYKGGDFIQESIIDFRKRYFGK